MNGIIRRNMTIDNMQEDEIKVKKYIELFNKDEKFIYFYHVQEINEKPVQSSSSGTIITKKVKYHSFARSKFYQEWINYFKDSKSDFNFMISDDMILATINLYDLIRFTVGFDLEKMMERHVLHNEYEGNDGLHQRSSSPVRRTDTGLNELPNPAINL